MDLCGHWQRQKFNSSRGEAGTFRGAKKLRRSQARGGRKYSRPTARGGRAVDAGRVLFGTTPNASHSSLLFLHTRCSPHCFFASFLHYSSSAAGKNVEQYETMVLIATALSASLLALVSRSSLAFADTRPASRSTSIRNTSSANMSASSTTPSPKTVVIAGGGVIGTSTAYYLAKNHGIKSILVDPTGTIAPAASGKAGGFLALGT